MSASVRVEKATSDLLIGPDWTLNMDICDAININPGEAKDVVKAVKKRMQHKNPKVQLLALTLLETMVKNCGDYVHFQIAEKNILQEMSKIAKKNTHMHVRDKILVLLDSWQEAFGGPEGKHSQYYWACEGLRRSGMTFPQRSSDAAPIFTPPVAHSTQVGYGMPINSAQRLDEAMTSDGEGLSSSGLDSMQSVMELLAEMLQSVNPNDRLAVKDELIADLAQQCRTNQKRLMQMLASTGDEKLLGRGLEINDSLQSLLMKYDAIASGSPLPPQVKDSSLPQTQAGPSGPKPPEVGESSSGLNPTTSASVTAASKLQVEEEEEEEDDDDFDQLARRHSKARATAISSNGSFASNGSRNSALFQSSALTPSSSNALALPDPPLPVRTTKEQDMIDLLTITLSTTSTSPHATRDPNQNPNRNPYQAPTPASQSSPSPPQNYPGNFRPVMSSYVVPWAQTHDLQPPVQAQTQRFPQIQPQPQAFLPRSQLSSGYPPPPWAATPGYPGNQNTSSTASMFLTQASTASSSTPAQMAKPVLQFNSFPSRANNGVPVRGDAQINYSPRSSVSGAGKKPFVPSYRLFEELNVLGTADGRVKATGAASSGLGMGGSIGQSRKE